MKNKLVTLIIGLELLAYLTPWWFAAIPTYDITTFFSPWGFFIRSGGESFFLPFWQTLLDAIEAPALERFLAAAFDLGTFVVSTVVVVVLTVSYARDKVDIDAFRKWATLQFIAIVVYATAELTDVYLVFPAAFPTIPVFGTFFIGFFVAIATILLMIYASYNATTQRLKTFLGMNNATFTGIRERLEKIYRTSPTRVLMYAVGNEAGAYAAKTLVPRLVTEESEFVKRLFGVHKDVNWCTLELSQLSQDTMITVAHGSIEAGIRDSKEPMCDFLRGYLNGIARSLRPGMEMETTEVKCQAKGDVHCEFVTRFAEIPSSTETGQVTE